MLEDRVITTDQLITANDDLGTFVQLGPGILRRLEPLGMHVLVPRGPLPAADVDPVLCCDALLRLVGEHDPLVVQVLIRLDDFINLPGAFEVLGIAVALVPMLAAGVEHHAD